MELEIEGREVCAAALAGDSLNFKLSGYFPDCPQPMTSWTFMACFWQKGAVQDYGNHRAVGQFLHKSMGEEDIEQRLR